MLNFPNKNWRTSETCSFLFFVSNMSSSLLLQVWEHFILHTFVSNHLLEEEKEKKKKDSPNSTN